MTADIQNPAPQAERFTVVSDDAGNRYIIPAQRLSEWRLLVYNSHDGRVRHAPWARQIDGFLTFTEWKVETATKPSMHSFYGLD